MQDDFFSNTQNAQFRQYSQTQGRWLSPDPYDGSYNPANPQSFNRYTYALNNPVSLLDPSGLDCENGVGMDLGQGGGDENPCEGYNAGSGDPNVQNSCPNGCTDQNGNRYTPNPDGSGLNGGGAQTADAQDPWDSPAGYTPTENGMGGWYGISYGATYGGMNFGGGFSGPGPRFNCGLANCQPLPMTPSRDCVGEAIAKNGVSLALDAAGFAAGLLPGGDLVVAGVQAAVSVGSGINSAAHQDAIGGVLGILGLPTSYVVVAAKSLDVGARAIPFFGTALSAVGALNDAYGAYQDYQECLGGH